MTAEKGKRLPEHLRIDCRITGEHLINFQKAAAGIGDVQFTPLDWIGRHGKRQIFPCHFPDIERVARQTLRRRSVNRCEQNRHCQCTDQDTLNGSLAQRFEQIAPGMSTRKHLIGNCGKLLRPGRQPAFHFRRQRLRHLCAYHPCNAQQRFELNRQMRVQTQALIDVCAAQQAIKDDIERLHKPYLLLAVTDHCFPHRATIRQHRRCPAPWTSVVRLVPVQVFAEAPELHDVGAP